MYGYINCIIYTNVKRNIICQFFIIFMIFVFSITIIPLFILFFFFVIYLKQSKSSAEYIKSIMCVQFTTKEKTHYVLNIEPLFWLDNSITKNTNKLKNFFRLFYNTYKNSNKNNIHRWYLIRASKKKIIVFLI